MPIKTISIATCDYCGTVENSPKDWMHITIHGHNSLSAIHGRHRVFCCRECIVGFFTEGDYDEDYGWRLDKKDGAATFDWT